MYLIIGGNGFLGTYIIESILRLTQHRILATSRNTEQLKDTDRLTWKQCDITDEKTFDQLVASCADEELNVVFLAAYHHPDKVAERPNLAWDINVTTLSRCINKLSFARRLFYASTDSVYGNSINGYHFKEGDSLHPVNIYGRQKCAAEAVVIYAGFHVVRYPFLIAPSLVPGKPHFYDWLAGELKNRKQVEMFTDSYRSSLHFSTAADYLVRLCEIKDNVPQIINICGDQDLSKYDIGLLLADKLGVERDLIVPIRVEESEGIFKTPRATSTLMDNTLVKQLLDIDQIKFEI